MAQAKRARPGAATAPAPCRYWVPDSRALHLVLRTWKAQQCQAEHRQECHDSHFPEVRALSRGASSEKTDQAGH